jgi:hypothetical protein
MSEQATVSTVPANAPPRAFSPPPGDVVDPVTRLPSQGSFEGPLGRVDYSLLGRSLPFRVAHEKAWYYVAIATPELFIGVAILRFGYIASTFGFLFERAPSGGPTGHFLADRSQLAPPFSAKYLHEEGIRLHLLNQLARFERAPVPGAWDFEVALGDFRLMARLSSDGAPPPVSAVSSLGDGLVQATEKRALLSVEGEAEVAGRRFALDGGFGGFDRSHGFLPRHTVWRWAFAMGRADTGEAIAFNLVDGFVGDAECCVWVDGKLHPVGMGQFSFEPDRLLRPWRVRSACGAIDLEFEPGDIHAEHQDLALVKTRFVQPAGAYSGKITVAGRTYTLSRVLGVTEDQDALW